MTLFKRDPETLVGYTPKFNTEETCLFYRRDLVEMCHGLGSFADEDEPKEVEQHSIKVLDLEIYGEKNKYYQMDKFDISVEIANEFIKNKANRQDIKEWLFENSEQLNNDKRYWKARYHRLQIEEAEAKIKDLQEQVKRGWIVHSMFAYEVKQKRNLSKEEKQLILTEFNGEEWIPSEF